MHLFIELITLLFFLITVAHAVRHHGREGALFFATLLYLGGARETLVAVMRWLYGFAPLNLMLGPAPLIGAIIWGYSIYAAVVWAGGITGRSPLRDHPTANELSLAALFMITLACFYEPILELIGMAKWEDGTRRTWGIPWIALIGYPTLTVPFLWLWGRLRQLTGIKRFLVTAAAMTLLAAGHAAGLQWLKDGLGW
ncbi:MAG: hypothetical protein AAGD38_18820 [Acidobacteriota bacterium]